MKRLISKLLTALLLCGLLSGMPGNAMPVQASSGDPLIGQISLFPYGYAPMGWHLCDGSVMYIAQNQALFALIGNRFGGNGTSTFALPDLDQDAPIAGTNYYIAMQGIFPSLHGGTEGYGACAVGEVILVPYTWVPDGFLPCRGGTVSTTDYSSLFALIGISFGGNGATTFGLPDLRAAVPDIADNISAPRLHYCICWSGQFPDEYSLNTDCFLGEIVLLPYQNQRSGVPWCLGQTVSNNSALYSLLGNKFGGTGLSDFRLPDLRGASPLPGLNYSLMLQGIYPSRS